MLFGKIKVVFVLSVLHYNNLVKIVDGSIFWKWNKVSANETCEIYMNDIVDETFEENPTMWIEININLKGQNK
jgi:hypothetical protein